MSLYSTYPRFLMSILILCLALPVEGQTVRVGAITNSINNWPMWVASAKGMFREEGLDVQLIVTGESENQLALADARELEFFHQAADHFVREIEAGKNYVVLHTITRAANDLLVRPEFNTFEDLRGKTIALDNLQTGYWLMYKKVLQKYGLHPGDYILATGSGGAANRIKAVRENRAQFTYMNAPESVQAELDGFPILTNLSEHYPEFPASSIGARRDWAESNRDTVVAYLRAYIRATEWLLDPVNRDEAIKIATTIGHNPGSLPGSYDTFIRNGMVRYGTLSQEGFRQVGELLIEGGVIQSAGPMEKYADSSYQRAAMQQR